MKVEQLLELNTSEIKKINAVNPMLAEKIINLKKEAIKNQCPYLFYQPNNKLKKFPQIFADNYISWVSGGNGSGKTSIIGNLVANIVYAEKNKYFDSDIFKNWIYPKDLRIVGTSKNVQNTGSIQTELKKWLIPGTYTTIKGNYGYDSQYYFPETGFNIEIMNYNQEVKEFEGSSKGLIIFDEPPPYEIFKAGGVSRTRLGGKIVLSYTPLDCAWIDDELINKAETGKRFGIQVSVFDNSVENGGILTKENIDKMIAEYDEDDIEARVYGKSRAFSGRIFKSFDPEIHCQNIPVSIEQIIKNQSNYTFRLITDPHDRRPCANILAAINKFNDVFIIAEFPYFSDFCSFETGRQHCILPFHKIKDTTLTIKDTTIILNNIFNELQITQKIYKTIDKNFGNKVFGNTQKTVKETFAENGFEYDDAYDNGLETGHNAIKDFLKISPFTQLPKIFVFPHCYNTKTALLRYTWDDHTSKSQETKHFKEKPKEKFKDFIDTLRYLLNVAENSLFIEEKKPVNINRVSPLQSVMTVNW